ncbi:MAG: hypothetical protein ACTSYR_02035 [Candidatus Odinarchaeia archaeon]
MKMLKNRELVGVKLIPGKIIYTPFFRFNVTESNKLLATVIKHKYCIDCGDILQKHYIGFLYNINKGDPSGVITELTCSCKKYYIGVVPKDLYSGVNGRCAFELECSVERITVNRVNQLYEKYNYYCIWCGTKLTVLRGRDLTFNPERGFVVDGKIYKCCKHHINTGVRLPIGEHTYEI